jgi:APA family basic amino acid/polyamine antiporter
VVFTKLIVIGIFIYLAAQHVNFAYWKNFAPFGWHGVMSGAAFIFFAYIGFDAVSTAAEETINLQRNMPIGIIGSLIICTVLYIVVSALLTLIAPYQSLDVSSPIAAALLGIGYNIGASIVSVGAIAGLTTVILAMYYGLTRVILAMSRDRLFPKGIAKIHPKTRTPARIIVVTWLIIGCSAAFLPLDELVGIVNIGTLAAFTIVCGGVLVLRYTKPDMPRPFKVPGAPIIPALGVLSCLYLIYSLPLRTWGLFTIWLVLGLIFYFSYGFRRARKAH